MKKIRTIMNALLVSIMSVSTLITPAMAIESSVTTEPVEGIVITNPSTPSIEGPSIVDPEVEGTKDHTIVPGENKEENKDTNSNIEDGLKDSLYDGSVLKENHFDLNNLFDRLIVKLRTLVENIRRLAVPILIISWMVLFLIAIARILSGERGATSRLIGGLFWVTFAYIGIVSAEAILYSLVTFVIGA